jgi:hypothetical protein
MEISESTISSAIQLSFPKTVKGIELSNPSIQFLTDEALFCADAKTNFINKTISFCTQFKPTWDSNNGQLNANNFSIQKIKVDGVNDFVTLTLQNGLNKEVLPHLGEIKLYQTDSWTGKQIKSFKLTPGKIEPIF